MGVHPTAPHGQTSRLGRTGRRPRGRCVEFSSDCRRSQDLTRIVTNLRPRNFPLKTQLSSAYRKSGADTALIHLGVKRGRSQIQCIERIAKPEASRHMARLRKTAGLLRRILDFDHLKIFFARPAFGTSPVDRNIFPAGTGRYSFFRSACGFIVDPSADQTHPCSVR